MAKGLGRLDRAMEALMGTSDRLERVTTLVWLRQLMDPTMPEIGGYDPRTIGPVAEWKGEIAPEGMVRTVLDGICRTLNDMMGEDLLSTEWGLRTDEHSARAAVNAVASWNVPDAIDAHGGDLLGLILTMYRNPKGTNGAYYTPWALCYLMAKINEVQPGESVCDPCCGSGRMLLAALQACREAHPGERDPVLYGVDIDHDAVRATKLNLVLAGVYSKAQSTPTLVAPAETPQGQLILEIAGRDALQEAA
jgi:hypothetical protein